MLFNHKLLHRFLFLTLGSLIMQQSMAVDDEAIAEEIVITGDRGRINLQLQVDEAEDNFFTIFNDLIDEEDFRIACKYEKVIGSLIKLRICQTKYMRDELTSAAMFNYFGIEYGASAALTAKNRALREKTIELLETNSEFRGAAVNLSQRVEEYRDEYGIKDDDDE